MDAASWSAPTPPSRKLTETGAPIERVFIFYKCLDTTVISNRRAQAFPRKPRGWDGDGRGIRRRGSGDVHPPRVRSSHATIAVSATSSTMVKMAWLSRYRWSLKSLGANTVGCVCVGDVRWGVAGRMRHAHARFLKEIGVVGCTHVGTTTTAADRQRRT